MNIDILRERVGNRLADLHLNSFEAARRAGLGRDFVNDILNGRKKSVRTEGLRRLADALQCDAGWLIGDSDTPVFVASAPSEIVFVEADIAAGLYREHSIETVSIYERQKYASLLPPDPRHMSIDQFDVRILDEHVNRLAPNGHLLRCVRDTAWSEGMFERTSLVIIRRIRAGLAELTARRFIDRFGSGENEYVFYSDSDQFHLPLRIGETDDTIEIIGSVMFAYSLPPK